MSNIKDQKYYWLKLRKDFFKRHDIRIVESMPNGKDYILFYLKLLVESVDHDGELRFSESIPYNSEMLATITNTNVDVVKSALNVFTELRMIDIVDDGTLFMSEVNKMLGKETYWAEKKRENRMMIGNCPTFVQRDSNLSKEEIETDKEIEIDKELEIEYMSASQSGPIQGNQENTNTTPIGSEVKVPKAEVKAKSQKYANEVVEIVELLNTLTGSTMNPSASGHSKYISAALSKGYTVEDLKLVVTTISKQWIGTQYEKYLVPKTLFNEAFDGRLSSSRKENEANNARSQKSKDMVNEYGF